MFKTNFPRYASPYDYISCELRGGLTAIATIYRDDCMDRPDERQDGFWPSLDPTDPGYIGPKSERTLAKHQARAEAVMAAWKNDEWFFCGVAVTIEKAGVRLTHQYGAALWGIECNYPETDKRRTPNAYLAQVANELLPEAIAEAKAKLAELAEGGRP